MDAAKSSAEKCLCLETLHAYRLKLFMAEIAHESTGSSIVLDVVLKEEMAAYLGWSNCIRPGVPCLLVLLNDSPQVVSHRLLDCIQEMIQSPQKYYKRTLCLSILIEVAADYQKIPSKLLKVVPEPGESPKRPISAGGFGDVYKSDQRNIPLARNGEEGDMTPSGYVAVKTIRKGMLRKYEKAIFREIILWWQLEHQNILHLLGVCTWQGLFPSMVSPWIQNGSINRYIQSQNGIADDKLKHKWLCQIANALAYLHGWSDLGPFIHLDVRCDNILVDDSGVAVLSDFGLTKINDTIFTSINSTVQSGNPRWTAPELMLSTLPKQLKASYEAPNIPWGLASPQCDIWSFGMTCLEVMTEALPFSHLALDGGAIWEVYNGKRPARPMALPEAVGWCESLWSLIQSCWNADPKNRPSAAEVLYTLEGIHVPS